MKGFFLSFPFSNLHLFAGFQAGREQAPAAGPE
jgi:hypothetical protein